MGGPAPMSAPVPPLSRSYVSASTHVYTLRKVSVLHTDWERCASINKASEAHLLPGQQVHQNCRRRHCIPSQIAKGIKQSLVCESLGLNNQHLDQMVISFASNQIAFFVVNQPCWEIKGKAEMHCLSELLS